LLACCRCVVCVLPDQSHRAVIHRMPLPARSMASEWW
jgi:hypothetical protein